MKEQQDSVHLTEDLRGKRVTEVASSRYPLDPLSVGDDTYVVMSKGHHDPGAFMRAVREAGYDWPLGKPQHKWVKTVPCSPSCGEHSCHYELRDEKPGPGWFPATYAWEAYGEDVYGSDTPS